MTDEKIFATHTIMGCYSNSRKAWEQADNLKKAYPNWYVSVHDSEDGYHYVIVKK